MAVYDEGFGPTADESRLSNMLNYAGAVLSLVLIVGVGFWGYKLVVRDVTGIPVVRAMEGDMRVLPDDPGGDVALHTGLAVNEVAASGAAGGPEDVLLLAPRDSGLAQEDLAVQMAPDLAAALPDVPETDASRAAAAAAADVMSTSAEPAPAAEVDEVALLAQMLAANPTSPPVDTATTVIPASVPGVRTSVRPVGRPAALASAARPSAPVSTSEVTVNTADLPAGTDLVHLGAYSSPAEAAAAWETLQRRLGQYLAGYERIIQVSNQSGGTWYRLRASGFADRTEARRLCAVLTAEYAECIPVVTN